MSKNAKIIASIAIVEKNVVFLAVRAEKIAVGNVGIKFVKRSAMKNVTDLLAMSPVL